jgi:hypothetical protein
MFDKCLNETPNDKEKTELWNKCVDFIKNNRIHCPEVISQCDWVITGAYDFIENVVDTVGYLQDEDE